MYIFFSKCVFLSVSLTYSKASQGTTSSLSVVIVMCFYVARGAMAVISVQADQDRK